MNIPPVVKTSSFIPFSQDVSHLPLPDKMNFPFYYDVHPLCKIAAEEVQGFLQIQQDIYHNFGLNSNSSTLPIGKMFGVLVVEQQGKLGYIAAYSGKLANSNSVAFFVPPVFDMLQNDGYFLKREEYLNEINHKIMHIETSDNFITLKRLFEELKVSNKNKIESFKTEIKAKKQARKQQRIEKINYFSEEEFQVLEEELIKESLSDKRLLKHLTEQCQYEENQLLDEIIKHQDEIDSLKELRKKESNALQQWLFENYIFLNARNEEKSLLTIFQTSLHIQPPAGAGECCAPKLFQYAYKNQLRPIALAEFWWGQSPKSEVRKHGQFYPSCWGKCEPILGHMLQGLEVEENPFLKNPAQGKELPIVYDDPYLVVVNKPAEFLSVPGIHISDSVYERIRNRYPNATGPLIVHRLDMSTSGVMVLAKSKEVHENLQKQFIKRRVEKSYIALLEGIVPEKEGKIELPLRVDLEDRPRQMVCYQYGKAAITKYKVAILKF